MTRDPRKDPQKGDVLRATYDWACGYGFEYIRWRSSHGVSVLRKSRCTLLYWCSPRYGIDVLINGRRIRGIEFLSVDDVEIFAEYDPSGELKARDAEVVTGEGT